MPKTYYIGLRFYPESAFGLRKLGPGRWSLNIYKISILFERY